MATPRTERGRGEKRQTCKILFRWRNDPNQKLHTRWFRNKKHAQIRREQVPAWQGAYDFAQMYVHGVLVEQYNDEKGWHVPKVRVAE